MFAKTLVTCAAVVAALVAVSTPSSARSGHRHFNIQDANTGQVLFDDGRMDGRACAVGSRTLFDPVTQTFRTRPAVRCNF